MLNALTAFEAFLNAHPVVAYVFYGYLLTGAANAFFEYIKLHENASKFLRFVDGFFAMVGLDAGVVVALIRKAMNAPPMPPATGAGPYRSNEVPPPPPKPPVSVKSVLRFAILRRYAAQVAAATLACTVPMLTGCGWFHESAIPVIDKILSYVQDAELVLHVIEVIAQPFFAANPSLAADAQAFAKADAKAHNALDAITQLGQAGKSLDDADVLAAVADFQAAYNDIVTVLTSHGIAVPGGVPHVMRSNYNGVEMPQRPPALLGVPTKVAQ